MNEEGAPFDSGFDDAGPFSVTPEADGVALDAALREFGPAAFDDLVPRLRSLAADLDAAHADGFIHGRLHPSKVFVTDDATYLLGARVPQVLKDERHWPIHPPYTAPEVVSGGTPTPMADQYSLAAIAYEWMFGRPVSGPAERSVEVRAIPNVDRAELSRAFTRALTPEPFRRFASCTDFCEAVAAASAAALPLLASVDDDADEDLGTFVPEQAVEPPRQPAPVRPAPVPAQAVVAPAPVPDLSFTAEESNVTAAEPDIDVFARSQAAERPIFAATAPYPAVESRSSARFGGLALILATLVGAVFGFAAGYMARPRALQTQPSAAPSAQGASSAPSAPSAQGAAGAASAPGTRVAPDARVASGAASAPAAPGAPGAPGAPVNVGRLLIRSTPSAAEVEVDGVARGVTPLALSDLDLGSRAITVSRRGYVSEERRIVLTRARPSRSVEVRLSAAAAPSRSGETAPPARSRPTPSTPASLGKPAVTTGSLVIESRPAGASAVVNGKPSGITPLTIDDLPPGEYRVTLSMQGFRDFATTVRVVAGERARAAARLTEQEQE